MKPPGYRALVGLSLLSCAGAAATVTLPINVDFEASEGFPAGLFSAGQGWTASAPLAASVVTEAFSGARALSLTGGGWLAFSPGLQAPAAVTWLDFYLKPVFAARKDLPAQADGASATAVGFVEGALGEVYAVNGNGWGGGDWLPTGHLTPLVDRRAADWLRLSYRIDYAAKRWDLFVDGRLVLADLGFLDRTVAQFTRFRLRGDPSKASLFDYFYVGSENPLYADTSGDGLPDAWLLAHGLSPAQPQRYADPDHDGVDNLTEFRLGLSPSSPDTDGDGVFDRRELLWATNPALAESRSLGDVPFADGFEADGPGPLADGTRLWRVRTGNQARVEVTAAGGAPEGVFSLGLTGAAGATVERYFADSARAGVVWLDFQLKAVPSAEPPKTVPPDVAAVFYVSPEETLVALDGGGAGGGEWRTLGAAAPAWHRISLRMDYLSQRWSLWLDGVRRGQNLGFAHPVPYFSGFALQHKDAKSAGLDAFQVRHAEPAGLDNDGDGLDNAAEIAAGTNPDSVDTDGDGISDPVELQIGLNPVTAESFVARLADEGGGVWAWRTRFSTGEGYAAGPLQGQLGWLASDASVTTAEQGAVSAAGGTTARMERYLGANGLDRVWLTFRARLKAGALPEVSALPGRAASLFGFRRDQVLAVYDPAQARWAEYPVASPAGAWNDYALHLDYRAQRWLLAFNGRLVAADLPFRDGGLSTLTRFRLLQASSAGGAAQEAFIDDLAVSNVEPAGLDFDGDGLLNARERELGTDPFLADTDGDGLPDGWEVAHGLAPKVADGLADPDGDGFSNQIEFQRGLDPSAADGPLPGFAHWEEWPGLAGTTIASLTTSADFPGAPAYRALLAGLEPPAGRGTNYGTRLRAWLRPPAGGDYVFWIAGDDTAELWLSTDDAPFTRRRIALTQGATGAREWEKHPAAQRSVPLTLQGGARYYLEVLHKQSSSSGHVAVGWKPPGAAAIAVIPGACLEAFPRFANDQDEDGLPDDWERAHGLGVGTGDAAQGSAGDADRDGLSNFEEFTRGLHPGRVDTDGDSVSDYAELELGTDPLDAAAFALPGAPAPWQVGAIGGKTFQWVAHAGGEVSVWTNSAVFGSKADAGGILYREVAGNFACDGAVEFSDPARTDLEGGLMVRDSLAKDAAFLSITRVLNAGWVVRHRVRTGARVLSATVVSSVPLDYTRFAVRRMGPLVSLYGQTAAGVRRKLADYPLAFTGDTAVVGYVAWCAAAANPGAMTFSLGAFSQGADTAGRPADPGLITFDSIRWSGEWDGVAPPALAEAALQAPTLAGLQASGAPVYPAVSLPGSSASPVAGPWATLGGSIAAQDRRGELAWTFTLAEPSVYLIELALREALAGKTDVSRFPLKLFVDDLPIGTQAPAATAAAPASALWFGPWLAAGVHTVRVVWDGAEDYTRLQADALTLHRIGGDDADANGVPDWIDRRVQLFNGIDIAGDVIASPVSPLPLEGRARWPQAATLTASGAAMPVTAGAGYRWYTEVALARGTDVPLVFSGENGAVARTLAARWTPHDALAGGAFAVRTGSRLLVAVGTGPGETATLTRNGATVALSAGVAELSFTAAGTYRLLGRVTGPQGAREAETVVTVFAPPTLPVLAGLVTRERVITRPTLATGVVLDADPRLGLAAVPANAAQIAWQADDNSDRRVVARAGEAGPILAGTDAPGSAVYSTLDTYTRTVETLPDGTQDTETLVILSPVRPGHAIKLEITVAGVVFADGTRSKVLNPADLDDRGQARVRILRPPGTTTSVCHRTHLLYNGAVVGTK